MNSHYKNLDFSGLWLGFLVLFCAGCVSDPGIKQAGDWQMERRLGSQQSACALASSGQPFATALGVDSVFIVLQDDGLVSLRTNSGDFSSAALEQMGIRVDQQGPVLGPQRGSTTKAVVFSSAATDKLIEQFATGKHARVYVVLAPDKEVLHALYSLRGFKEAYKQYNLCRAVASSSR